MARHTSYGSERALFRDPRSGLRVIRLTHSPCISHNMYFEMCSFTADDEYVILRSQRYAGRDAPYDLLRARTDGMELLQLTEYDDLSGMVASPATGHVLYQTGGEVRKMDMVSLDETTVAKAPGTGPGHVGCSASIDRMGETYFSICRLSETRTGLFWVSVATGETEIIHESESQNHVHASPDGKTVHFNDFSDGTGKPTFIDADGANLREYTFRQFAHHTWFGEDGRMQGTLVPPGSAIVTWAEGEGEPTFLTQGRYYWHSGTSLDAQWIVADTNWPQEGLYMLHVPSRTVSYLCDPRSSCSHPQWTHPHPALSPNMKYVVFNSDMTGVGQVYLVELTEEFLEQAAEGYVCRSRLISE